MTAAYFPLRVRTGFSFGDGIIRPEELAIRLTELALPGAAIADRMNVFGVPRFSRALREKGLKPVIGAGLSVVFEDAVHEVAALCLDASGFRSLSSILTKAYARTGVAAQRVSRADLESGGGGLALIVDESFGAHSPSGPKALFESLAATHGDRVFYGVSLAREGVASAKRPAPDRLIATDIAACLTPADQPALLARWCIEHAETIADVSSRGGIPVHLQQVHLRSSAEMVAAYASHAEALANSVALADRAAFALVREKFHIPGDAGSDAALAKVAKEGLAHRLQTAQAVDAGVYEARLDSELAVIRQTGFAGYFLLVNDFTSWARAHGVAVGPGRGSGAGSLVAWALRITDVDPVKYDLLFERFLNAERVSLPDFDIDLCARTRDRVIGYLRDKFGNDRVAQIATFSTLGAKGSVRDAARILGKPVALADHLSRAIPGGSDLASLLVDPNSPLSALRKSTDHANEVLSVAMALEGLPRQTGTHAGGVIVCSRPIEEVAPLYRDQTTGARVVQFDKDDAEAVGLVKFDLLGLTTLTIIEDTVASIAARTGEKLDSSSLPLEDPLAYNLICAGDVGSVFQLESAGMRQLLRDLKPDRFEDVVAAVALYRPGPLQSGMVQNFIAARHGRKKVSYPHALLEPVLKSTYGVFVYQEQVMQAAQVMADYSLGEADQLRRAMGKKKPEEMAKLRAEFIKRAVAKGVVRRSAEKVFDLCAHFAGYGFNKSHAVAYAQLAVRCAYLRAHFPADFFAAALSFQGDGGARALMARDVGHSHQVKVLPPDVLLSSALFTAESSRSIRCGLTAIRGVGYAAADALVAARSSLEPRPSFDEWAQRVPSQHLNVRVLRALAASGALDRFGIARELLVENAEQFSRSAVQSAESAGAGQADMFGSAPGPAAAPRQAAKWDEDERAEREREVLGFSPAQLEARAGRVDVEAASLRSSHVVDVLRSGHEALLVGTVEAARVVPGAGEAVVSLADPGGIGDVYVSSDVMPVGDVGSLVGKVVVARTWLTDAGGKILLRSLEELPHFRARECAELEVCIARAPGPAREQLRQKLASLLKGSARGAASVRVKYAGEPGEGTALPPDWDIAPTPDLLSAIGSLVGKGNLRVVYRSRSALP